MPRGGFQVSSGTIYCEKSSYGIDTDNSETTSPVDSKRVAIRAILFRDLYRSNQLGHDVTSSLLPGDSYVVPF